MLNKLHFQLYTPYSQSLQDFDFIEVLLYQIRIVLVCSLLLLNIFENQM